MGETWDKNYERAQVLLKSSRRERVERALGLLTALSASAIDVSRSREALYHMAVARCLLGDLATAKVLLSRLQRLDGRIANILGVTPLLK